MPTKTFKPIRGKRMRVTQLDACGNVPTSGNISLTTSGFISVSLSSETEDGEEVIQKNANGDLYVNEQQNPSFKRFTAEIELCEVNPELLSFLSNAEAYQNYAGDNAGITVDEGTIDKRYALELWTGLSGQACDPGVEEASGYMLLPLLAGGVLSDISVQNGEAINLNITGSYTVGGNGWGVGPYEVVANELGEPSQLPTALGTLTHFLFMLSDVAPPPAAADAGPIPPIV